jgi:chromosome segregation protein
MLIKKVVIQGFKTFANRTEFVFDPGITAVVGPNGSGKSNVVDAVRWCLGEQSFSLLRSKKTSDIIFAGSDKRARLGMAQVSVTLDNSGGEIPIDYVEVEISRRAYRDGDNEYLINGQKVRLQDVSDLLSQTGLGKRTYSVIGQGLIDRVLSLAPEERRSIFEEAAGITGYQVKRDTALRRLDATQQNLTRVRDITTELAPRLGYLRRQAERAREHEQMATDLRGLLREWYGYRWHASLAELTRNHADATQLQDAVTLRQRALAELSRQIEHMRAQQAKLRSILADLHREGSGLHRDAESVGRDLAVTQERLRQTQERQEDAERELALLRTQQETAATRSNDLLTGLEQARLHLSERVSALQATEAALDILRRERTRTQEAVDQARRSLTAVERRQTDSQSRLSQLRERQSSLRNELESQRLAQQRAVQEMTQLSQTSRQAEAALAKIETQIGSCQETLASHEQSLARLRQQLEQAEVKRREADRTTDRLQTRVDLLKRLHDEGAGYATGVRAVLQANLPGVLGPVASLLHVPAHLDKAIETALGGALQNIITERWDDAQRAIDHLKRSGRGRATFLPQDRLSTLSAIAAPKLAGVLGNALSLVSYDASVAEAMRHLLNRVWVTESLPIARRALDTLRDGSRPTVVTLDGDIVRPGGAVTGGSDGERRDESVLSRERELRELPGQIVIANHASQHAAGACSHLASQLATTQVEIENQQRALADLAQRERFLRQQAEEARRNVDRAQQAADWQAERQSQQQHELASMAHSEEELSRLLEELAQSRADAESALSQAEADQALVGGDELMRELADRRAGEADAQGRLRSQQQMLDAHQRAQRDLAEQIRTKEARRAALATEIEQLQSRVQQASAREAELSGATVALQRRIQPVEAQLAQLETAQATAEGNERTVQQALRRDESAWGHAQLLLQRSEDAVQQLREEIQHDLGLVTLEQSDDVAYQPPLPWDTFVEQLPVIASAPEGLETEVREMRARLSRLVNVNPDAPREYDEAAGRYEHLLTQSEDLEAATTDLRKIIRELDETMKVELTRTFNAVAIQFRVEFQRLFNGGNAELVLSEPEDITNSGIDIVARPPGKRPQSLALLSGGERALAACALIFAILRVSPTPFCVLDEVDAALDEANVDRFRMAVELLSEETQFIIVTHNRRTLEGSNTIYGVTMGNDGVSKVISLRLEGDKIVHHNGAGGNEQAMAQIEEIVKM